MLFVIFLYIVKFFHGVSLWLYIILENIMSAHNYTTSKVETAAVAANAGCNLELGFPWYKKNIYSYLGEAVAKVR